MRVGGWVGGVGQMIWIPGSVFSVQCSVLSFSVRSKKNESVMRTQEEEAFLSHCYRYSTSICCCIFYFRHPVDRGGNVRLEQPESKMIMIDKMIML